MTFQALNLATLMLGFGGFGLTMFLVGTKVGQIVEAAWWKGKLEQALTATRDPSPSSQTSLVCERRELGESALRPASLLLRPPPPRLQAGLLTSQRVLGGARQGGGSVNIHDRYKAGFGPRLP
jgi:hypothetical protein